MWEPVIATDFGAPSTAALNRIRDRRAAQFWDKGRLLSRRMGERDGDGESVVWDYIAIYARGVKWEQAPPAPLYGGRPVVDAIEQARSAIVRATSEATIPPAVAER